MPNIAEISQTNVKPWLNYTSTLMSDIYRRIYTRLLNGTLLPYFVETVHNRTIFKTSIHTLL